MPESKQAELLDAELLTVGQAAERLGISADTLRRWTRLGRLKSRRNPINNYRLYSLSDVEALRRYIRAGMPNSSDRRESR